MSSDAKLLRKLSAGGNPGVAFETLYARHKDAIYRYAVVVSQSSSIAQDATQETFVQMIERAGDYDASRSTSAIGWLYGLLRNNVRRHLRDTTVELQAADEGVSLSTERLVELSSAVTQLNAALPQLKVEQREVLYLVALQGLDYEATSEVLDIPVGTVRSRLSRARSALRTAMQEGEHSETMAVIHG